jgi:hypothetical protein
MRYRNACVAALGVVCLIGLAGCGGGGHGLLAPSDPLVIMTSTLPAVQSGDTLDYEIPLGGGCSGQGPYVVEVIDGSLPDGVGTDGANGRHHLTGVLLEDGHFEFTIKITDTSCTPFLTTTQAYVWDVAQGPLRIVGANPDIVPQASYAALDPQAWPDIDALPKDVYGQYISYKLIAAGGVGPYVGSVIDDPADPNDDNGLPTGVAMVPNSTSFVGTPIQVGPGGKPFRLTFRVTDSVGGTAMLKLQFKVDTPPIVIANAALVNGRAGKNYADTVQVIDGVPPFKFELLDDVPTVDNDAITYNSPNPPTFPSASGFTVDGTGKASNKLFDGSAATYPGPTQLGPYSPFPPEGVSMVSEDPGAGGISGLPRRAGDFTIFVHAYSALVPNENGQHAFKTLTFTILPSEPPGPGDPAFGLNPSFTVENTFVGPPNYSTLPEFEVGQTYNPDGGPSGLQLIANGGVPADGYTDAPHRDQRAMDFTETAGAYKWVVDWDVNTAGTQGAPTGLYSDDTGLIDVTAPSSLQRVARQFMDLTVTDYQLPLQIQNSTGQRVAYSVGPDIVILTYSTRSLTEYYNYYSASNRHRWNDTEMQIKKFQAYNSGAVRQDLDDSDLVANHTIPTDCDLGGASNQLGALLSGSSGGDSNLDLMRCVVNATGWWDDIGGMNPLGARPMQHADFNRSYCYYGEQGYSYSYAGNWQPSVSCVELPDAQNVSGGADPANGIYTDGGRLYHFESANRFGVFIIREDGKIDVPFAKKKDYTYEGFGDTCLQTKGLDRNSAFRTVQMTVSPDGRFAAMKLKHDMTNLYESATSTTFVIFSLTGEKPFGGESYKVIGTGTSLTGSGNRIAYAASMALTNNYLYFLIGSRSPTSNSDFSTYPLYYQAWSGHFFMRYQILGGASDAHMLPSATGDSNWTQASGVTMQTVFQYHGPNVYSSSPFLYESYTYYGYWPYSRYFHYDGMSMHEHNVAPGPFRVSRDGTTAVFFAAADQIYGYYYGTDVYSNFCWVDRNGGGATRVTGTRRRHSRGSGRGYTVYYGPDYYGSSAWGRYSGPTPGVEVSDDGTEIAFDYLEYTGYIYGSDYYYYSSFKNYRYNVILTYTTNNWSTYTERNVTSATFGGSHHWRFGAFAFTEDGTGMVFWAGSPVYSSTSTSYTYAASNNEAGCFYITPVTGSTVTSMCATADGGSPDGAGKTYSSSSPFSPSSTSGQNNRYGAIAPYGGFISRNRKFMYVVNFGSSSSSDATSCKLIGMNIQSYNSGSFNGHSNGRAFTPAGWPNNRGFIGPYYYYYGGYYPLYYGYAPEHHQGIGMQVMAKDTGWVFWGTGNEYYGPTTTYYYYGSDVVYNWYAYGCYGYGGVGLYGFNADMGGKVAQLDPPGMSASGVNVTSPQELLNYIEVSRDGSKLLFVTTGYYYMYYKDQERVNYVTNIDFDTPDGSMSSSFNRANDSGRLDGANGRAGEAMGISGNSQYAYYAYKQGSSNETNKEMVRAAFDPTTKTWTLTRYSSITGRMNVLFATR